jgi:hypothetical protein
MTAPIAAVPCLTCKAKPRLHPISHILCYDCSLKEGLLRIKDIATRTGKDWKDILEEMKGL